MGLCLGASSAPKEVVEPVNKKEFVRQTTASTADTSGSAPSSTKSLNTPQTSGPTDGPGLRSMQSGSFRRDAAIDHHYELGDKLGEGAVSLVRAASRKADGEAFAVKVLSKNHLYPEEVRELHREVEVLQSLSHPSIIRLEECYEDEANFYVVEELVTVVYTEAEARDLFVSMVSAVRYLHDNDVVHRDLKLENLLMVGHEDDTNVKIADFGFATRVQGDEKPLKELRGTPRYIAPEILKGVPYGKAVDMWSIGVITFILLGGFPPFYDNDDDALYEKIKSGSYRFYPDIVWELVSDDAKDLIQNLLHLDPDERLTADDALRHPWVRKPESVLRQHSLVLTQAEMRKFNARQKFRASVDAVIATNRWKVILKNRHTAGGLETDVKREEETKEEEEVRPAADVASAAVQ